MDAYLQPTPTIQPGNPSFPANSVTVPFPQASVLAVDSYVAQQLQHDAAAADQSMYQTLTQEEHEAVLQKMVGIVQTPAGHLPRQEELYLEQQLTDMLGFEVVAELEGVRLPYSIGMMAAQPHLRRHPTDLLMNHVTYLEAGIRESRGGFGWFTEMGQLTPAAIAREKYYISVPISFLPTWQTQNDVLKNWMKFRKMLVINPAEQCAVVSAVGDIGPADWMRAQFGGAPEVIRSAKIWSPNSRGHVLVMFINDPHDTIPLGLLSLRYDRR